MQCRWAQVLIFLRTDCLDEAFNSRQRFLHHHRHPLGIGVHLVLELQGIIRHDAIEKEGIKRQVVFFSQPWKDRVEPLGVIVTHIRRRHNADQQHGYVAFLETGNNGIEVLFRLFRRDAPQRVIGAELQNDPVGSIGNRPFRPGEPPGGGITGDTGVRDRDIDALRLQCSFKLCRVAVGGGS